MVADLRAAAAWMQAHPDVAIPHDQALLHLALLLGGWRTLNLCRPPHGWASSWAGDYRSPLAIIQTVNTGRPASHLHYSGFAPATDHPLGDLLTVADSPAARLRRLWLDTTARLTGWREFRRLCRRARTRLRRP